MMDNSALDIVNLRKYVHVYLILGSLKILVSKDKILVPNLGLKIIVTTAKS
jgi:hypothetical protein